jgi:hypothetical protein
MSVEANHVFETCSAFQKESILILITDIFSLYSGFAIYEMTNVCLDIMQKVQKIKHLEGKQKKEIVLYILKKLIENLNNDLDYEKYIFVLDTTISPLIDLLKSLDKKKLYIKKVVNVSKKIYRLFSKCAPF